MNKLRQVEQAIALDLAGADCLARAIREEWSRRFGDAPDYDLIVGAAREALGCDLSASASERRARSIDRRDALSGPEDRRARPKIGGGRVENGEAVPPYTATGP